MKSKSVKNSSEGTESFSEEAADVSNVVMNAAGDAAAEEPQAEELIKENEKKGKKSKDDKVGFGTLMLWQSRMISTSIAVLIFGYLMIYCTDTMKIPAAAVSLILVLSKVLDGVTDLFAGFIVDKTKTRWGKARPYEVFVVGLMFCTWLLFSCPESFSTIAKCIWIFVMYGLANAICYTFLNANNTPYIVRAFKDTQIVKLTSYGSIVTMLAAVAFNVAFPMLMGSIATSASGWSRLILLFAVPMAAIGLLRMIFIPEKYDVDVKSQQEPLKVKDIAVVVKTNKFILLICMMTLIFNFVCNMGVNVYYYTYIVKNVGLMGVASLATIVAIPLALFFPKLISKFTVVKLMFAGFIISAFGYLLNYFAGANLLILIIAGILTGAGTIPASMLSALVILECADFNEWKGIHRMEGTMSSFNGFAAKVGAALGTAALGILMSLSGYTGDAATMPDSAINMIRMLFSIVPMVLYILTALSLRTYKLDKLMPQIKAENEANRKKYEEEHGQN